jgi:hypothetical protein
VFASGAGVLHDEARHRMSGSEVDLQEERRVFRAPPVGLATFDAAVHSL